MITFSGKVIRGDGFGKKLGFPTANIDRREFVRKKLSPRLGIYGGCVIFPNGKKYKAAMVVGPIDKQGLPKLEAHILNFSKNLYGRKLTFQLYIYMRPFKKYTTMAKLTEQISKDVSKIKQMKII